MGHDNSGHYQSGSGGGAELKGEKMQGKIKYFNHDRGFGFIERDDRSGDVFVHISALERSGLSAPEVGDRLEFEMETDSRSGKVRACDLRRVSGREPVRP